MKYLIKTNLIFAPNPIWLFLTPLILLVLMKSCGNGDWIPPLSTELPLTFAIFLIPRRRGVIMNPINTWAGSPRLFRSYLRRQNPRIVPEVKFQEDLRGKTQDKSKDKKNNFMIWKWFGWTGFNPKSTIFLTEISKHLTNYTSKISMYTDPVLSVLLREDMRARLEDPQVEDLTIMDQKDMNGIEGSYFGRRLRREYKDLKMPFKLIPNCSRFVLLNKRYDWISMLLGYPLKAKKQDVIIRNWKNGSANKFLISMFLELKELRDCQRMAPDHKDKDWFSQAYFKKSWRLLQSRAYRISALQHVFPNWYQDISLDRVYKLLDQVADLAKNRETMIKYSRTYIPKKTDLEGNPVLDDQGNWQGVRPLGVPSPAWRIYLHMLNNIIVWYRQGLEGSQHAYLPGKGVSTAWQEIMDYIDFPYIYEFDLSNFFDKVNLNILSREMGKYNYHPEFIDYIHLLNQSIIKLPSKDLIKEPERKVIFDARGRLNPNFPYKKDSINPKLNSLFSVLQKEYSIKGYDLKETTFPDLNLTFTSLNPISSNYKVEDFNRTITDIGFSTQKNKGVPQGCPTSCGLSTIVLDSLTKNNIPNVNFDTDTKEQLLHIVMYADDGVIFSKDQEGIDLIINYLKTLDVTLKESGSRYVKRSNKWEIPLKFCGLEYGLDKTMRASTRRGSKLEFDSKSMFLAFLQKRRHEIVYEGSASHLNQLTNRYNSPKDWINNELYNFLRLQNPARLLFEKTSGFILASLFSGTWNLHTPSVTTLLFKKKSWISRRWYAYQQEILSRYILPLFESEFNIEFNKLGLNFPIPFKKQSGAFDVEALKACRNWLEDLKDYSKPVDLKDLAMTRSEMKQLRGYKNNSRLNSLLNLVIDILEPWGKGKISYQNLLLIGSLLSINYTNASSFACNDLLRNSKLPTRLIQFVLEEPKKLDPKKFPRTSERLKVLIKYVKSAFKEVSGVPLILKPFFVSIRPSIKTEFLDSRGYYKRQFSSINTSKTKYFKIRRKQPLFWLDSIYNKLYLWWISIKKFIFPLKISSSKLSNPNDDYSDIKLLVQQIRFNDRRRLIKHRACLPHILSSDLLRIRFNGMDSWKWWLHFIVGMYVALILISLNHSSFDKLDRQLTYFLEHDDGKPPPPFHLVTSFLKGIFSVLMIYFIFWILFEIDEIESFYSLISNMWLYEHSSQIPDIIVSDGNNRSSFNFPSMLELIEWSQSRIPISKSPEIGFGWSEPTLFNADWPVQWR